MSILNCRLFKLNTTFCRIVQIKKITSETAVRNKALLSIKTHTSEFFLRNRFDLFISCAFCHADECSNFWSMKFHQACPDVSCCATFMVFSSLFQLCTIKASNGHPDSCHVLAKISTVASSECEHGCGFCVFR